MINKMEAEKAVDGGGSEQISPLIVAKICLNIAIIRSQLGDFSEAVCMHERSLMYKAKVLPQLNDEIRDQYVLLAFAQ